MEKHNTEKGNILVAHRECIEQMYPNKGNFEPRIERLSVSDLMTKNYRKLSNLS